MMYSYLNVAVNDLYSISKVFGKAGVKNASSASISETEFRCESIHNATEANDVILIKFLSFKTVSCVDGFSDVVGWLEALFSNEHVLWRR